MVAFEFAEVVGIVSIGQGDSESVGIAEGTSLGVASDTGRRGWRDQTAFAKSAVKAEGEWSELKGEGIAEMPLEHERHCVGYWGERLAVEFHTDWLAAGIGEELQTCSSELRGSCWETAVVLGPDGDKPVSQRHHFLISL